MAIVVFAKNITVTRRRFNNTEWVSESYNVLEKLRASGVPASELTDDIALYTAKSGETVFAAAKMTGAITCMIGRIDENGELKSDYNGTDFNKPVFMTERTLLQMNSLFNQPKKEAKPAKAVKPAKGKNGNGEKVSQPAAS